MKPFCKKILALAVSASAASTPAFAQEAASITEALKAGKAQLHLRFRYEDVEEETLEDAAATTLKTRLTYTSGTYEGFGLTLEMDDTTELGKQDYSDGVTNRGTTAIADPEVTEVNQAFISYTKGSTTAKYGRQRIILDNQRFVGGVSWRQDEQTYDGFTLTSKPAAGLALFYGYVTDVNRIFAEAQDHNHESHLLNAKYDTPIGSIIGYGYLLENKTSQGMSSDTFGARWQGKAGKYISYNLEYAQQKDAGENPTNYSADYNLAEINGSIPIGASNINLGLGYELLGSDDGIAAFTTSLATLHAFQGWSDKFLATPAAGIEDTYFSVGTTIKSAKLSLVYHTYSADEGDLDYGSEFGFVVDTKVGPVGLTFKYADYSADAANPVLGVGFTRDTQKLWLTTAVTF
jgi:hypothetical protein